MACENGGVPCTHVLDMIPMLIAVGRNLVDRIMPSSTSCVLLDGDTIHAETRQKSTRDEGECAGPHDYLPALGMSNASQSSRRARISPDLVTAPDLAPSAWWVSQDSQAFAACCEASQAHILHT